MADRYDTDQDGGPAFPQLELVAGERDGHGDAIEAYTCASGGMTLRDWFAAKALAAMLTHEIAAESDKADVADQAYFYADAMIAARKGGA